MTLKPNPMRAFLKTFLWVFILIVVFQGVVPWLQNKEVVLEDILAMALIGSSFLGASVAILFTPREITWDEETVTISALLPGSGRYTWQQLEAYSSFGRGFGTFLIKFKGQQAFQIVPAGFQADEWKSLQSVLRLRFPEKKTWLWLGPIPVNFGR